MAQSGGCHCGAIRYEIAGDPIVGAICHCVDCRRAAGAPAMAWTMLPADAVNVVKGAPKTYASSEHGRRQFCGECGAGLFYSNAEMIPGLIDVQTATLDDPSALPPAMHMMTGQRIPWTATMHDLPAHEGFPPQE